MNEYTGQDPFDPQFDPDRLSTPTAAADVPPSSGCGCGVTRRQALLMAGSLAALPLTAVASPLIPCVQTRQQVTPCRHKFCRHYRGDGDYYGR